MLIGVLWVDSLPGRSRRIDLAHTDIAGEHLIERFPRFFSIALAESVLTMAPRRSRPLTTPAPWAGGHVLPTRPLALWRALAVLALATASLTPIAGIAASSAVLLADAVGEGDLREGSR